MKKLKFKGFLTSLVFLFLLGSIFVSLSSKAKNEDELYNDGQCSEVLDTPAQLQINFSTESFDFARNSAYQGFIPSPDLRWGDAKGIGGFLSQTNKYYCSVTITSPQCISYHKDFVLSSNNSDGNGKIDVLVPSKPSAGIETTIRVEYFEVADAPHTPHDFNVGANPTVSTRLMYTFEETYQGAPGTNVPQPISLSSSFLVSPDGTFDIGKNFAPEDYESINDFINNDQ